MSLHSGQRAVLLPTDSNRSFFLRSIPSHLRVSQSALLSEELQVLWRPFDAAFVGFLVFLLVLGIGGPTGASTLRCTAAH